MSVDLFSPSLAKPAPIHLERYHYLSPQSLHRSSEILGCGSEQSAGRAGLLFGTWDGIQTTGLQMPQSEY